MESIILQSASLGPGQDKLGENWNRNRISECCHYINECLKESGRRSKANNKGLGGEDDLGQMLDLRPTKRNSCLEEFRFTGVHLATAFLGGRSRIDGGKISKICLLSEHNTNAANILV